MTRLPDNFKPTRDLIINTNPSSMEIDDPEKPKTSIRTKVVIDVIWNNVHVKMILVFNLGLKSSKKGLLTSQLERK